MAKQIPKSQEVPLEYLDDIASRFLLDATSKDIENPIAVCFLTELSYWFYMDEYLEEDDNLNHMKFDTFALQLLNHVKFKPKDGMTIEELLAQFKDFKHRVPCYGALILNEDLTNVLLVQGYFYKESWGFPKGKINENEEPHMCAIREVLEETGFDIGPFINPTQYIENVIGEQKVRLYIIPGIPMTTVFTPKTKNEIKELKWFPIYQLPTHKHDRNFKKKGSANMFYTAMPFIKPLKEWIAYRTFGNREGRRRTHSSGARDHSNNRHSGSPVSRAESANYRQQYHTYAQDDNQIHERPRYLSESSMNKKDSRLKVNKSKKNLFAGATNPNQPQVNQNVSQNKMQPEDYQKFQFKNRNKKSPFQNASTNNSNGQTTAGREENKNLNSPMFRSYTWQNFRINKKGVNDALDKVWAGIRF